MGINSTATAYKFGQLGSAYSDVAQTIVPPVGKVICAITFIEDGSIPTILTPEKLGENGPNFVSISGGTGDDLEVAGNNYFNFNGIFASHINDATHAAGGDITLATSGVGKVKVGQYVLLVNDDANEEGADPMVIESETPVPIYKGPNQQGVKVTSFNGSTTVTLDTALGSCSSKALIFLDEQHGAGGITAAGQAYPANSTIYGRWTALKPSAAGVICYFGY